MFSRQYFFNILIVRYLSEHFEFSLLQDHIHFTLGRQSFNLRLLEDAQIFFRQLLEYESLQAPEQQASYLREFLFVFKVL